MLSLQINSGFEPRGCQMDYVDIDYKYDNHLMPQRFSIAGDMIVPTFENLNSAKQAEYLDKVTNDMRY